MIPDETLRGIHANLRILEQSESWVAYFSAVLGPEGLLRTRLDPDQRREFQESPTFRRILEHVAHLRAIDRSKADRIEPEQMITARLPLSLHGMLVTECDELPNTSLNQLVMTKMIEPVNERHHPDLPTRRGRGIQKRPGGQPTTTSSSDG